MKSISSLLIVCCALFLLSCNFSVGTKKDLMTGLGYSYNGFGVEEVLLVGPDNIAKKDNKVEVDTRIAIVAQGLSNYVLKDGKAFPGIELVVTDKEGNVVMGTEDLFAESAGYSPEDASVLRGTITVGEPMKSGETYHIMMRVWDKNKIESTLTADVDIEVQ